VKFEINISVDNAAFEGDALPDEVARILLRLSKELNTREAELIPDRPIRLADVNGNRVGYALLSPEEPV